MRRLTWNASCDVDPNFDVFVADCHRWLLCPPKAEDVADEKYTDKFLDRLIQTHKQEQLRAREAFEEHKRQLMTSPKETARSSGRAQELERDGRGRNGEHA